MKTTTTAETYLVTITGELSFRTGNNAATTGLFLSTDDASYEVFATTTPARRALCSLDDDSSVRARVCGSRDGTRIDAIDIELAETQPCDDAASVVVFKGQSQIANRGESAAAIVDSRPLGDSSERLGRALIALYAATAHEPASTRPPRRLANMYFHPEVEGRELRTLALDIEGGVVALAIYDPHSSAVWFREVSQGDTYVDTIRGPFRY